MTITVVKAPHRLPDGDDRPFLFLAGSIEMGTAEDWQSTLTHRIEAAGHPAVVCNPRRDDWDSSWRQSIDDPQFRQQVTWELDALERAAVIAMFFHPTTKAPITLLEMGLFARSGKLLVGCPPGFWRRGNIEVVCDRFGIPLYADLGALGSAVVGELERLQLNGT